ncbi:MAG: NDP-sugar synthase [bacterium]
MGNSPVSSLSDAVDAIILVGGQGTRLRPLTLSAPKPMLPTAGVPFLEHPLSRIRAAGIRHVILSSSYKSEVFESHFGDGSKFGLELDYVVEEEPLGTGGGIGHAAAAIRASTVLVFNGDLLSGVDLGSLLAVHRERHADVTLYLTRVNDPRAFGCVPTDSSGRVTAFLEKDPDPITDQINAGTYVFERHVVDAIPSGRPVSVERETFPQMLKAGATVIGQVQDGYWRDLGTPADFVAGSADLVRGIAPTLALPAGSGERIVLHGADVDPTATVDGGSTVGASAVVGAGAEVAGSVLFDDAVVEAAAVVRRSVIGRGARVAAGAVVVDAVLGDRAIIGSGNELAAGARVWPDVTLAPDSLRFSPPS